MRALRRPVVCRRSIDRPLLLFRGGVPCPPFRYRPSRARPREQVASLPRRLAGPSWDATGRARASGVDLVGVGSGVVSRGMLHARSRRTPSATTWADLAHTTAPVLNVITAVWRLFCCCFPGRPALLFFILLVSWVRTCGPDIIIVRTFMLLCVSAANAAARSCHFSCCCVSLPTRLLEVCHS